MYTDFGEVKRAYKSEVKILEKKETCPNIYKPL